MKKIIPTVAFALTFAMAVRLRAQTGCTDSPEDPTIVLALMAGAAALAAGVRGHFGRKRLVH